MPDDLHARALLDRDALRQVPRLVHVAAAEPGDVVREAAAAGTVTTTGESSSCVRGTYSTWSASRRSRSSPSVATAITVAPRAP